MEKTDLDKLGEPIAIEDIDFRIQSINKGGYATILAYKDARVDINRLNAVCGVLGWKREHTRDNHNCIVSVWDDNNKQWVSKEDTGTESNTEQQKGLASDSFKRACFNWGIGLELYDYPLIQVKLNANEVDLQANPRPKATWNLKLKEWKWQAGFTDEGKICLLIAIDNNGKKRFEHSSGNSHTTGNDVGTNGIDLAKVEKAYAYFVAQIDNEEQDDVQCAEKIQKAWPKLTPDEQIKVDNKLKLIKHDKRQYNTILKSYLEINTNIGE